MVLTMRWQLRDFLTTNGVAAARVEAIVEKLTRLGLRGVAGLEFSVEDRESGDAVQDELMRFGFEPIEAKLLANTVSRLRRARAAALQPPSAGGAAAPSGGQAAPVMIQPQVSALPLVAAAAPNAEFMAQLWLQALAGKSCNNSRMQATDWMLATEHLGLQQLQLQYHQHQQ